MLARIVHVADAFDAVTSARAYRPALDTAIRELWRSAGTQFDAEVVQALVQSVAVTGPRTQTAQPPAEVAPANLRELAPVPAGS
jgi:HD-GYP domain-containing protein (c-di-GMP phosphodiesterase class II)